MTFKASIMNKPHNCAYDIYICNYVVKIEVLMELWLYEFLWYITFTSISAIYKKYSQIIHHSEKAMETRIFNKHGRRCREVKN